MNLSFCSLSQTLKLSLSISYTCTAYYDLFYQLFCVCLTYQKQTECYYVFLMSPVSHQCFAFTNILFHILKYFSFSSQLFIQLNKLLFFLITLLVFCSFVLLFVKKYNINRINLLGLQLKKIRRFSCNLKHSLNSYIIKCSWSLLSLRWIKHDINVTEAD